MWYKSNKTHQDNNLLMLLYFLHPECEYTQYKKGSQAILIIHCFIKVLALRSFTHGSFEEEPNDP